MYTEHLDGCGNCQTGGTELSPLLRCDVSATFKRVIRGAIYFLGPNVVLVVPLIDGDRSGSDNTCTVARRQLFSLPWLGHPSQAR